MRMRNRITRKTVGAALAAVCLLTGGCYTQVKTGGYEGEPGRGMPQARFQTEDLILKTDQPWYEVSEEDRDVTVKGRLENYGAAPVLLSGCPNPPSVVVEEWDGSEWRDGLKIGIICDRPDSRRVIKFGPGEWIEFDVRLKYAGWYRLRLLIGTDPDQPTAVVHSNQFLIR